MLPLMSSGVSEDITEMTNNIGFIGAGKVGTAFGNYLKKSGVPLVGYWSRTYAHAEASAEFTGSRAYEDMCGLIEDADIVFITVSDGAIGAVADEIGSPEIDIAGKTFCHTSGALTSETLDPLRVKGAKVCSAHMLLAVSGRDCDFSDAFFTVEGDCEKVTEILECCGNQYKKIDPADKVRYHAAAVFASNFVVGLADIACNMLGDCGFSEIEALKALAPLIENNVKNIINKGPKAALTGPVSRGDFGTVKRHLNSFDNSDSDKIAKDVYEIMTKVLISMVN